jgi:hypothetical protein
MTRPSVIWQFANKIKKNYAIQGHDVSVYADIKAKLNGRPYQQFTNKEVDLTKESYPLYKTTWIMPLKAKLSGK